MAQASPPLKLFLDAAADCGVGKADGKPGGTPRKALPFSLGRARAVSKLPWAAACLVPARLHEKPQ
jgi:hypothetical protein